jgi:hypothetical protein
MKAATTAASTFVLALILSLTAMLGIAAAVHTSPSLISPAEYVAAQREIRDQGRVALAACRNLEDAHERAVCRAEARASERIAAASLDVRYRGTVVAVENARRVEEHAEHSIAVARRLLPP